MACNRGLVPLLVAFGTAGCAGSFRAPDPEVAARAGSLETYSARIKVSLDGPSLRARVRLLIAFSRPDELRIEIPGASGARLIAVAARGQLTAAFPADRAVYLSPATPDHLEALLGVGLAPAEMIDMLVGIAPVGLQEYRARWGSRVPEDIRARLRDGGKLRLEVEEAHLGPELPEAAFQPPPHERYRLVTAAEARQLWGRR